LTLFPNRVKRSIFFPKRVLSFFFILFPLYIFGQVSPEKVKAALILRFCENVTWPRPMEGKITIGCYADDLSVYEALKPAEVGTIIHGLPIVVKKISTNQEIANCQAVYYNKSGFADIVTVNRIARENNVLLITDNYEDQLFVMINLVNVQDKIGFKVNMPNMVLAGFVVKPNLLLSGGSLVDIKSAYEKFEARLNESSKKLEMTTGALAMSESLLVQKDNVIKEKEADIAFFIKELERLKSTSIKLSDEIKEEKENLKEKSNELNSKEVKLKSIYTDIEEKQKLLIQLQDNVKKYQREANILKREIDTKNLKINTQDIFITEQNRLLVIYLSFIAVLVVLAGLLYSLFLMKRKYTLELEAKNRQIKYQHDEMNLQNEELIQQKQQIEAQWEIQSLQKKQIEVANEELLMQQETLEQQVNIRTIELKESTQALILQNQQLEEFTYVVAHNLRGPVATLLGLVNVYRITKDKDQAEALDDYFNKSNEMVRRIDEVIKGLMQILLFENKEGGIFSSFPLAPILEDVKVLLKAEIESNKATVISDLASNDVVYGVPVFMNSILYNLVNNAIRYKSIERNPVILVKTEIIDDRLLLTISDNGIGIDLQNQSDKLFKLFSKLTEYAGGVGIGLYTVRMQVRAMKGLIDVESKVGVGTTFKITLPYLTQSKNLL